MDASAVHFGCGLWGLISVGLFATPDYVPDSSSYGVFYGSNGKQLGMQLLGCVVLSLWAAVLLAPLLLLLQYLKVLRVGYEEELAGLDKLMLPATWQGVEMSEIQNRIASSSPNPQRSSMSPPRSDQGPSVLPSPDGNHVSKPVHSQSL